MEKMEKNQTESSQIEFSKNIKTEQFSKIRELMTHNKIDAYIITGFDPHLSEYPEQRWKMREIILGFSGSAGTIIVLPEFIGLWVDSRYHIQAEQEIASLNMPEEKIEIFKEGILGVPHPIQWLKKQEIYNVGVDGETISLSTENTWREELRKEAILLNSSCEFLYEFLLPTKNHQSIWRISTQYTGQSAEKKILKVKESLDNCNKSLDALFISSPIEICWLLNIRGEDIDYNPIVFSFLLINKTKNILFIETEKIPMKLLSYFESINVIIASYDSVEHFMSTTEYKTRIGVNSQTLNAKIAHQLKQKGILIHIDIVDRLKAIKNPIERSNIREAMRMDGIAVVKFQNWLKKAEDSNLSITEWDCVQKIYDFRCENKSFITESFSTIAGYNSNGAIVHYATSEEKSKELIAPGLLLIDSGGHYMEGTTDITRTFYFGKTSPSAQYIKYYTAVLQGHIALATAKFPKGTKGYQLDSLARAPLWKIGGDYGHGTGHGVGFCLVVHEGPQRISMRPDNVALEDGMVLSNEPGYYKEGEFGIRIENLLLCIESKEYPGFLEFENLTFAPYDKRLIDQKVLTGFEQDWLTKYDFKIKELLK